MWSISAMNRSNDVRVEMWKARWGRPESRHELGSLQIQESGRAESAYRRLISCCVPIHSGLCGCTRIDRFDRRETSTKTAQTVSKCNRPLYVAGHCQLNALARRLLSTRIERRVDVIHAVMNE